MLLGDAHVVGAIGEALAEQVEPGARRHGRGDRHDLLVAFGFLDQGLGEHLGVARRVGGGLGLLAGDHVELDHPVVLVRRALGRSVALALLGDHVDQHRPVVDVAHIAQDRHQVVQVMAVDRAHVVEAQLLEQGAAGGHAAGVFLGLARRFLHGLGQHMHHGFADLAQGLIQAPGHQARQIGAHAAHGRGDGHIVVVEHHDQLAGGVSRVVHGLVGHARAHGAVADHGDDLVVLALLIARRAKAQRGGYGGGRVCGAEGIVLALGALGETRQAPALAQGANAVAPAGENLVRIGLMAHVPDHDVLGRLEHMVQGDGQFDNAQTRAQVAAGGGHCVDHLLAHVARQLLELGERKRADVGGGFDRVEQGCFRHDERRDC